MFSGLVTLKIMFRSSKTMSEEKVSEMNRWSKEYYELISFLSSFRISKNEFTLLSYFHTLMLTSSKYSLKLAVILSMKVWIFDACSSTFFILWNKRSNSIHLAHINSARISLVCFNTPFWSKICSMREFTLEMASFEGQVSTL